MSRKPASLQRLDWRTLWKRAVKPAMVPGARFRLRPDLSCEGYLAFDFPQKGEV
ncbi:MAG: hypothetical protein V2J65_06690 [Desulfobacteraceae bacterium]|nr:hypothetical protein [Desulfobacteraceae bacterium]